VRDRVFLILSLAAFAGVVLLAAPRPSTAAEPAATTTAAGYSRIGLLRVYSRGWTNDNLVKGAENAITVVGLSWSTSTLAGSDGRELGKPSSRAMTIVKEIDRGSHQLFRMHTTNAVIPKLRLELLKADTAGVERVYQTYCMKSARVVTMAPFHDDHQAGLGVLEEVSFVGTTMVQVYTRSSTPYSYGWDYLAGSESSVC
jgi:type VI secretion system Hcp family effector